MICGLRVPISLHYLKYIWKSCSIIDAYATEVCVWTNPDLHIKLQNSFLVLQWIENHDPVPSFKTVFSNLKCLGGGRTRVILLAYLDLTKQGSENTCSRF